MHAGCYQKNLNFRAVASVKILLHLFLHLNSWHFSSHIFSWVLSKVDEGGQGSMHPARAPQLQSQKGGRRGTWSTSSAPFHNSVIKKNLSVMKQLPQAPPIQQMTATAHNWYHANNSLQAQRLTNLQYLLDSCCKNYKPWVNHSFIRHPLPQSIEKLP